MTTDNVCLRQAKADDEDFIYSTWLHSFRELSPYKHVPKDLYFDYQKRVVAACLEQNTNLLLVNGEDSDQIFSFISLREDRDVPIVSYVYTKPQFRGRGYARYLLESSTGLRTGFYSHYTSHSLKLAEKANLVYVPFFDVLKGEINYES